MAIWECKVSSALWQKLPLSLCGLLERNCSGERIFVQLGKDDLLEISKDERTVLNLNNGMKTELRRVLSDFDVSGDAYPVICKHCGQYVKKDVCLICTHSHSSESDALMVSAPPRSSTDDTTIERKMSSGSSSTTVTEPEPEKTFKCPLCKTINSLDNEFCGNPTCSLDLRGFKARFLK